MTWTEILLHISRCHLSNLFVNYNLSNVVVRPLSTRHLSRLVYQSCGDKERREEKKCPDDDFDLKLVIFRWRRVVLVSNQLVDQSGKPGNR